MALWAFGITFSDSWWDFLMEQLNWDAELVH
jgi:hypothetical protein